MTTKKPMVRRVIASDRKAPRQPAHKPLVESGVPVVAIGASAGGLDPIGQFLTAMPVDSGLAFVVIQHLDPAGKSILPELLAKHTAMRVQVASDGAALMPGQVYVIPPSFYLSIKSGKLYLKAAPLGVGARMPIDTFLRSLAADRGRYGVGIILSGTGTDGALGMKALKEAGGLTLVQEPSEAQHDGMPRQAILTATPDHVLPVTEMPAALLKYIADDYTKPSHAGEQDGGSAPPLAKIVDVLKSMTGQSFERYKIGTVQRRIERRMGLQAITSWEDYLALLRRDQPEAEALAKDLLIHVTQFFRDPEAFTYLADKILPELLTQHSPDQPVRIWVPGCSTGEEAYSLGMLLMEQISEQHAGLTLQIFATDIDEAALRVARAGIYPDSIRADVSPQRLERFFTPIGQQFQIANGLRQSVIFSRHDLLSNPPFSRLDLISCRNLFIYLQREAQQHVLELFHFALRADGLLFLGAAESPAAAANLFEPMDQKHRLYKRLNHRRPGIGLPIGTSGKQPVHPGGTAQPKVPQPLVADLVERKMLETYAPAAVAINQQFTGVYFTGPIDRYLQVAPGEPNQDVLSMAREGLRPKLREVIARAFHGKRMVAAHGVRFKRGGKIMTRVTIEAQQIEDDLVLVSFIDELPGLGGKVKNADQDAAQSTALADAQVELADTRKELNQTIRELRRANEEMSATNEEALSLNEELLSANEELETSKEELQSLNEELTTLNGQLRQTLEQQQQTSTDLTNLLNSTGVATLFLDSHLNIKVFNPAMKSLFAIIDKDIGRPIADLLPKFSDPNLLHDALHARSNGLPIERETQAESGAWYLRTVLPYRTESGEIQGEVVTFADVSQLKKAELAAAAARLFAEAIVDTVQEPLVVLDAALTVLSSNTAFRTAFELATERTQGKSLRELGHVVLGNPKLLVFLDQLLRNPSALGDIELELDPKNGGLRVWKASAHRFSPTVTDLPMILLALADITDQRRIIQRQLQLMIDALPGAVLAVDGQRLIRFVSKRVEVLFGYSPKELIGQKIDILVPAAMRSRHVELQTGFMARSGEARPMGAGLDIRGVTKGGQEIPLDIGLSKVPMAEGLVVIAALHDLRTQKQGEIKLREAVVAGDRANEAKSRFLAAASHDLRQPLQTLGLLLGVLTKRTAEPEVRTIISKLEDVIAGMSELTDSLLDLDQIERGGVRPEITDFPVSELLTHLNNVFGPLAAAKGLDLRFVSSSGVIRSDHRLLERMLGNLLSNAIKYTDQGKILLGCRRQGGKLRIEVWDTGIGIPEDQVEAVFDEFRRLKASDNTSFGLGLGLYIVRRFATLLGHTVELHSYAGKGTVVAIIASTGDRAALPRTRQIGGTKTGLRLPTVLLVEDDPRQLESLRLLVEADGYHVMVARNGAEALAMVPDVGGSHPDVILADYNLPGGITGLEVIKGIRRDLGRYVPALIMSGDKSAATLHAFEASSQAFVTKPVKAAELLAVLGALVDTGNQGWLARRPQYFPVSAPVPEAAHATVCVIDDEPGIRDAMRMVLEAKGHKVTALSSGEALFADPDRGKYLCLVVDVGLRGMDGLELQGRLKAEHNNIPIIFVTGTTNLPKAVKAIRDGATDFLQKPVSSFELCAAVARALETAGRRVKNHADQQEVEARLATLTDRERQVMEHVVTGEGNKIIAADLGISLRTVEHHRQNVMRKTGVKSLAALVRIIDLYKSGT
jgi:two-component system CheB/CheR fusion protein